jgi:uncharacterized protein YkwD
MYTRIVILSVCLLVALIAAPAGTSANGLAIAPEFAGYYAAMGGPATLGDPLGGAFWHNDQLVQYFERARLEYQPGALEPVHMGRLGAEATAGRDFPTTEPFASTEERWYLAETGHSLAEPFLSAWLTRGGVARFGFPISEPMTEVGRTVQYFERTRFEHHPERVGAADEVQLGALGREMWLQQAATLAGLEAREAELGDRLNEARTQAGQPILAPDPTIAALARERAEDMANRGYFSHTTPEGRDVLSMLPERGINYQYAGETIQRNNHGAATTVAEAARALLASPAHQAILLDGRFSLVGVGHAERGGMHYYAVVLVQP